MAKEWALKRRKGKTEEKRKEMGEYGDQNCFVCVFLHVFVVVLFVCFLPMHMFFSYAHRSYFDL